MAKKCCDTCKFNFYGGAICAGHGITEDGKDTYGMSIEETKKLFPNGCVCWGISFEAFVKEEKANKRK